MKLEKEHKWGIVNGIIASFIFIYFLQPLLDLVSRSVVYVFSLSSSAFIDRIFAQAAHLQTQDYSFGITIIIFGFFSGVLIGYCRILISFLFGKKLSFGLLGNVLFPLSLINENKKTSTNFAVLVGALYLIFSFYCIVIIAANYIQLRTISSFQQHMRIIAPYINEGEEKMIFSRWSLMKSHADYESVYATIRSKAKDHNIVLPENTIYSASTL